MSPDFAKLLQNRLVLDKLRNRSFAHDLAHDGNDALYTGEAKIIGIVKRRGNTEVVQT
jgi:hypothetical protein